jgi:hypothetical protein
MRQPQISHSKTAISVLILVVLGLHAVPVVFYEDRRQTLWPFLTWTMYSNSRPPGPIEARKTRIIGITLKGRREEVTSGLVGLPGPTVVDLYTRPMRQGDSSAAQRLLHRINSKREDPFVELRLEVEQYSLTDGGVVVQEAPTITYRVDAPQSKRWELR